MPGADGRESGPFHAATTDEDGGFGRVPVLRTRGQLFAGHPSLIAGTAAAITLAAIFRKGAFYWPDYVVLPGLLAVVAAASSRRVRPPERRVILALAVFVAWWLIAGFGWGIPARALQLAGSVVGFGAAFMLGARLNARQRGRLEAVIVDLGISTASLGLIGFVLHTHPLAMASQDVWRLAGVLTYPNATGVLLALTVPFAIANDGGSERWRRAAAFVILTGLLATLSRGAVLAALVSLPLLDRGRLRATLWPALLAVSTALVLLTTVSTGPRKPCLEPLVWGCGTFGLAQVLAFAALGTGLALAVRGPHRLKGPYRLVVATGLLAFAVAGSVSLRSTLAARADLAGVDARFESWSAALAELERSPVVGVGPERSLVMNGGRQFTYFAHNEYLQIGAGAGIVGLVLLGVALTSLVRAARASGNPRSRVVTASLLALGAGGLFDFVWHLPAVGMTAGWVASLYIGGGYRAVDSAQSPDPSDATESAPPPVRAASSPSRPAPDSGPATAAPGANSAESVGGRANVRGQGYWTLRRAISGRTHFRRHQD